MSFVTGDILITDNEVVYKSIKTNPMSLQIKGVIEWIGTEVDNGKIKKKEFVVKTDETYPQMVKCELINDKINLLSSYVKGDAVDVSFNFRGREWQGKYFTNIQVWKITKAEMVTLKEEAKTDDLGLPF
jgi:single-strand DNA-binding protein